MMKKKYWLKKSVLIRIRKNERKMALNLAKSFEKFKEILLESSIKNKIMFIKKDILSPKRKFNIKVNMVSSEFDEKKNILSLLPTNSEKQKNPESPLKIAKRASTRDTKVVQRNSSKNSLETKIMEGKFKFLKKSLIPANPSLSHKNIKEKLQKTSSFIYKEKILN